MSLILFIYNYLKPRKKLPLTITTILKGKGKKNKYCDK